MTSPSWGTCTRLMGFCSTARGRPVVAGAGTSGPCVWHSTHESANLSTRSLTSGVVPGAVTTSPLLTHTAVAPRGGSADSPPVAGTAHIRRAGAIRVPRSGVGGACTALERVTGGDAGFASDVYSLAATVAAAAGPVTSGSAAPGRAALRGRARRVRAGRRGRAARRRNPAHRTNRWQLRFAAKGRARGGGAVGHSRRVGCPGAPRRTRRPRRGHRRRGRPDRVHAAPRRAGGALRPHEGRARVMVLTRTGSRRRQFTVPELRAPSFARSGDQRFRRDHRRSPRHLRTLPSQRAASRSRRLGRARRARHDRRARGLGIRRPGRVARQPVHPRRRLGRARARRHGAVDAPGHRPGRRGRARRTGPTDTRTWTGSSRPTSGSATSSAAAPSAPGPSWATASTSSWPG